jgi:hypothetical protein
MADEKSYWPIPKDLGTLHDVIIGYAVRIQAVAAAKQEKTAEGPISHSALHPSPDRDRYTSLSTQSV